MLKSTGQRRQKHSAPSVRRLDAFFTTLRDALAAVEADAVLVTTPVGGHVPVGLEAVAAGKHVMVEKPLASSTAEGRLLSRRRCRAGRCRHGESELSLLSCAAQSG